MANEKRLIDANALKERAIRVSTVKRLGNKVHCYIKAVGTHEIDKAPTVDAVEVVHGRWIEKVDMVESYLADCTEVFYECSVCETANIGESPYCPNCGAKMDGGNEDG